MRDFSIESAWNAIRMAFMLIGGWLGTFLGNADRLLILLIARLYFRRAARDCRKKALQRGRLPRNLPQGADVYDRRSCKFARPIRDRLGQRAAFRRDFLLFVKRGTFADRKRDAARSAHSQSAAQRTLAAPQKGSIGRRRIE